MQRTSRRPAVVAVVVALVALALLPVAKALPAFGAVAPDAAAGPTANLVVSADWGSGREVHGTVTNGGGSTMTAWTVGFDLAAGASLGSVWDARVQSSAGQHVVLANQSYNGAIAPGASVTFGFLVSGPGGAPSGCTLNGQPCGGGTPTPTPSTPPTTPTTTPTTTATPTTPPGVGSPKFAPYIDITRDTPTLTQVAQATGQKTFTLAFVLGSSAGCSPAWGGTIPLNEPRIVNQIKDLQAMGGDVVVAFGGAMGPYLETSCGSAAALAAAYEKVIDTLGIKHLDVDVEASIPTDQVNTALAQVQRERPGTTVSYTLMIQSDDYGLTPALGVDVLKSAKAKGVRVDIVNPMTMDFGSARPWGDAVIAASTSVLGQMAQIWPEKTDAARRAMLGVTPMIGRNDNGKVFDQAAARQLVTWAKAQQIGSLAFWSVGRDNGGCPGGAVSPSCSSIAQSTYEFTTIFSGFR